MYNYNCRSQCHLKVKLRLEEEEEIIPYKKEKLKKGNYFSELQEKQIFRKESLGFQSAAGLNTKNETSWQH